MKNIDDLKPYLNLRDGEEILFVTRKNEDWLLPIKNLYKYHEPEKFPEELITKKKKNYVYQPADIITNFRIIRFGLSFKYVKEDQITPISEVFHFENFIIWINNEDILDFDIDIGYYMSKAISFIFYIKGGIRDQENSIYINCFKYKKYLQIKELGINLFKFKKEEIDQAEQKRIGRIIGNNKEYFYWGLIILVFLGIFVNKFVNRDVTIDFIQNMFTYSSIILYFAYIAFFLIFSIININNLQKTRKSGDFLKLMDVDLPYFLGPVWYKGPIIYTLAMALELLIIFIEVTIYIFVEEDFIMKILWAGMIVFVMILVSIIMYTDKKNEKTA